MTEETQYRTRHVKLLNDASICSENRALFDEFFRFQEYKLRRIRGLAQLDEPCYKTLKAYIVRLRAVNRWFDNRPWKQLTKAEIQEVYDAVEDGKIATLKGTPYTDRTTYYRRILLGKPFELAGKKELAREVFAFGFSEPKREARFIREDMFRKLVDVATRAIYKLMLWLGFDIGENMTSLLQLRASDCVRQHNPHSGLPEYHITLRREILKRSRTPRTEITNYDETVALLDELLAQRSANEPLFTFGYPTAVKVLKRAVRITGVCCIPYGQPVTLKDLRSSMACDLLTKGWTTDEASKRLGHEPGSLVIKKYANWLALDRHQPKRRMHETNITKVSQQLDELRTREKLQQQRLQTMQNQVVELRQQLENNNRAMFEEVKRLIRDVDTNKRAIRT